MQPSVDQQTRSALIDVHYRPLTDSQICCGFMSILHANVDLGTVVQKEFALCIGSQVYEPIDHTGQYIAGGSCHRCIGQRNSFRSNGDMAFAADVNWAGHGTLQSRVIAYYTTCHIAID